METITLTDTEGDEPRNIRFIGALIYTEPDDFDGGRRIPGARVYLTAAGSVVVAQDHDSKASRDYTSVTTCGTFDDLVTFLNDWPLPQFAMNLIEQAMAQHATNPELQ